MFNFNSKYFTTVVSYSIKYLCIQILGPNSNIATLLGTETLFSVIILYILPFFISFQGCLKIGGDSGEDFSFIITLNQIQTFPCDTMN